MQVPKNLKKGDRIAILSPASTVNPAYVDGAANFFRQEGYEPVVMPHAKGPSEGSYAASDPDRIADLRDAYIDDSIRAVLCARGGYGCNHLIDRIPEDLIADNPKWLIGFSDITALHALSQKAGVLSLHAPMAKHLTTLPADHYCIRALMNILENGLPVEYKSPSHTLAQTGIAHGTIIGGNLAVFNGLSDTPYDPLRIPGPKILLIEDIAEAIYAVERMLIRIKLSGRLSEVTGIIFGQFTDYRADRNFQTMEEMISNLFKIHNSKFKIPIALSFPVGHTDDNLPIPLGASARLTVTPQSTTLTIGGKAAEIQ